MKRSSFLLNESLLAVVLTTNNRCFLTFSIFFVRIDFFLEMALIDTGDVYLRNQGKEHLKHKFCNQFGIRKRKKLACKTNCIKNHSKKWGMKLFSWVYLNRRSTYFFILKLFSGWNFYVVCAVLFLSVRGYFVSIFHLVKTIYHPSLRSVKNEKKI